MRSNLRITSIEPEPSPEEVAAIVAALESMRPVREESVEDAIVKRSRWRLAGLLGHQVPRRMKLEGSLWAYSSWEGIV